MNQLAESTSLYLQQHANNPVDWHLWDEQALALARSEQRPILLSIGYSACHWCHVMAHESFEDPEIARWMNALFVNIKVDREERPDLDRIYQLSHQLLTGRGGGWPLTVFLDPADLTPFFAGTYFPPEPRHGLPGFAELLKKVRQWYDTHREEVAAQNRKLVEAIASMQDGSEATEPPGMDVFATLDDSLRKNYDAQNGGFGGAPKFPQAPLLALVQFMAQHGNRASDTADMLHDSLTRMALSGLRDHLDGGFFRYTVDGAWTIPHFEKMLYDNAMLLPLYAEAAMTRDDPFLAETAAGIVDWLGRHMRHDNGGFYASIDADADGKEGGFHVWQREEVEQLLNAEDSARVCALFGLDQPPNFEGHAWHLVRADGDTRTELPRQAMNRLLEARAQRIPPATDTKQLAAWNALCIEGLARAGMALNRQEWLEMAEQALQFVRSHLWHEGRLYAVYAGDRAQFPAYLDDHAGLLNAILVLLQGRWSSENLQFACQLGEELLDAFADAEAGGFFFSAASAAVPVHRLKPFQDDALPSGNGVAVRGLLKLGHLLGDARYLDAARMTLTAATREIEDYPLAHASLLLALADHQHPVTQVLITGHDQQRTEALRDTARQAAGGPFRVNCYTVRPDGGPLPGMLGALDFDAAAAAFVCRGLQCLPPVTEADQLTSLLTEAD
jgi:uncharacterized protein YyaL (SSP411 family)